MLFATAFRDVARRVMLASRLNTAFFAQAVEFTRPAGEPQTLTIKVRHRVEQENQPDGTVKIWDTIDTEINDEDLDTPPDYGDRIVLAGDDQAYLYAYAGHHRLCSYKATFRRQRLTSQGTKGER